ncbi:hypothetical protein [Mesorhizobium sp. M0207]|uniref:hypothetical protein n=1 Tax=Mesorhizobium sp. M0207 TaxID=2956915 RepID=UPI00333E0A47
MDIAIDAAGLAQIVRTEVRIRSQGAYVVGALLSARDMLVGIRWKIENEIRGLLKTFGVMFGKKVGGFARCAEAMIEARGSFIERIRLVDTRVRAVAKQNAMARLFMTAPGVGVVIALTVASTCDDDAFPLPLLQLRTIEQCNRPHSAASTTALGLRSIDQY